MAISNPRQQAFYEDWKKAVKAALFGIFIVCGGAQLAQAQTPSYSEDFVSGTNYNAGDSQVDSWETFRDDLTGSYSSITVGGSEGPGATCGDPTAVASITSALNTDTASSIACDGRTWNIGPCAGELELSIDAAICTCQAASTFTLRPDLDAGNAAWGGIGATCGPGFAAAGDNVDQTLTISLQEFGPATDADLSLTLTPATTSPTIGANTFVDIDLENVGPATGTGVEVLFQLPSGLTFVSDDSGGDYNPATGIWSIGNVPVGSNPSLRVLVEVQTTGNYNLLAEISVANENDTDSTPGNAATLPNEDDSESETLFPVTLPPPSFCLGRPIQFLSFVNPVLETGTGSVVDPDINDVYRFGDVAPGFDALVQLTALDPGTSIVNVDNAVDGFSSHFQPTLVATAAGGGSATFEVSIVATGTNTTADLDFAVSGVDIDGGGAGLFEFVEVSDNFVESALNSIQDITEDAAAAPAGFTRFISTDTTIAGSATDPSGFPAPNDTEADFPIVDGISLAPPHIFTAFYTDVVSFTYRIGATAPTGGVGRLNSLAFNCPDINATASEEIQEDFGDAPFDETTNPGYGNPIHVITAGAEEVQIGMLNDSETGAGNSATASSDAGDEGVTIGGASFQGASFTGLVPSDPITIEVTNNGSGTGMLQAFVDWNIDGDFDDAGEQVATDLEDTDNDGMISLVLTPPVETVTGQSFARFRWSTSSVGVQDPASNGEVEDYLVNLSEALPADLSLTLDASTNSPAIGEVVTLTVTVSNDGPGVGTGIISDIELPAGLSFVSSDGGAAFDEATGLWTLPADLASGASATLTIQTSVNAAGTSIVDAQIIAADQSDPDSTPNNAATQPGEDDNASETIIATTDPAVCPADLTLFEMGGNATAIASEIDIDNASFALGALSASGTGPAAGVAAGVDNSVSSVLVLDLGVVVPENALLVLSLARDPGAGGTAPVLEIRSSLTATAFPDLIGFYGAGDPAVTLPSSVQDQVEHISVTVPAGGLQFLEFDIQSPNNALVDGISFSQSCLPGGELEASKTVAVFDPLGEGLFALPGNDVIYTINVQNSGGGAADEDSIFLIDELPDEVVFFNGDADGPGDGVDPVNFEDVVTTGLDPFVFADSVAFAEAGTAPESFADCTLTATAGFDENIRFVCFNPKGVMNGGAPNPEFNLTFRARIR